MSAELQSAVRKLKWLSLAISVMSFAMLAVGVLTLGVGLALLFSSDTFADQTDSTGRLLFTLTMVMALFINLLSFGVPGALMLMAYRRASDSLTTQTLQSLVPVIVWLRHFLMCAVVLLLALLSFTALIPLIDLVRYLRG
jgi:hypothetical protein